ncbi:hypothetical protein DL96DRAFT_1602213 [Flagelloscypha sp. PMI_526]|nr:hypothetical protein DL96DRAFT_1602213 [Flagelloscypha sp. PMI_526]
MSPRVVLAGEVQWGKEEVPKIFAGVAEYFYDDSPDRATFLKNLGPGGKWEGTVGIYRENGSSTRIGIFDKELFAGLPNSVKWIAHNGAGYDQIDVLAAKERGIYVSNTPGAVDEATATTALYLTLSALRRYSQSERNLYSGGWVPPDVCGIARDMSTRTIGVLGMGGIGLYYANLVHAFPGLRVVYHNRKPHADAPTWAEYHSDPIKFLEATDVLSIHCPLNEQTVNLVSEEWIRAMKPGSVIINTARGKVLDEVALIRALEDGHIASAGLDVFPDEPQVNPRLKEFPQVCLLPHVGTENRDSRLRMEVRAFNNLKDYITKGMGKDLVKEFK